MGKDKNKKSFWEEFFGISDDEVSRVEKMPTAEEASVSEEKEDNKILDVLEGKNKKVIPVQSDSEDFPEVEDNKNDDSDKESKKVIPVKIDLKDLPEAPVGSYFFVHNGPTLKNLHDLEYYLGTMTGSQFKHHTADGRNDFASWVRDVLGEKSLALQLERAQNRESMQDILAHFLSLK